MTKRIAVIDDATNTGGRIITASGSSFCGTNGIALLGDIATCPKCKSSGKIIEGTRNIIIDGKPAAYDGCIIACKCSPIGSHRIIATKSTMFIDNLSNNQPNLYQSSFVENKQAFNKNVSDKWIGFQLPLNKDYSGLSFVITLDNGQLLKGCFDKNNKARLPIDTECDNAKIKIENLKYLENDNITSSITETLLKNILG